MTDLWHAANTILCLVLALGLCACPERDSIADGLDAAADGLRLSVYVTNAKGEACAVQVIMAGAAEAAADAVETEQLPDVLVDLSGCGVDTVKKLSCDSRRALLATAHYFEQAPDAWDQLAEDGRLELEGGELAKCEVEEVERPELDPGDSRPTINATPAEDLPQPEVEPLSNPEELRGE